RGPLDAARLLATEAEPLRLERAREVGCAEVPEHRRQAIVETKLVGGVRAQGEGAALARRQNVQRDRAGGRARRGGVRGCEPERERGAHEDSDRAAHEEEATTLQGSCRPSSP